MSLDDAPMHDALMHDALMHDALGGGCCPRHVATLAEAAADLGAVADRAQCDAIRAQHARNERGWCSSACPACRLAAKARLFTKAEQSARFLAREGRG